MDPNDPEATVPPEAPATIPAPPPSDALAPVSVARMRDFNGFASEDLEEE